MSSNGQVYRISISEVKGEKKKNVPSVRLEHNFGLIGDAHAGSERQVSLLPFESFSKVNHPDLIVQPGEFAENVTTIGLSFDSTNVGDRLLIGNGIELEITQIGKECHNGCYIREVVGDCIMPREGVFARVTKGGTMQVGDKVEWKSEQL